MNIKAKELRRLIVAHDQAGKNGNPRDTYIPCHCGNCESNRSKLFALTGKPSSK